MKKLTTKTFIQKAKQVHGNKYDYSKVEYINSKTKVCIICPIHGSFYQTPYNHLNGHICNKCAYIIRSQSTRQQLENFIQKANQVHCCYFDYSQVIYVNNKTKVCIVCPVHGKFYQTPSNHLNGCSCPNCHSSKGELQIKRWLLENNISFIPQYKFEDCKNVRPLPFDFYLPELNICIEFDGEQHFRKENRFYSHNLIINDNIKSDYCNKNKIELIRVYYRDKRSIDEILSSLHSR